MIACFFFLEITHKFFSIIFLLSSQLSTLHRTAK
jgi:hypothetical protein